MITKEQIELTASQEAISLIDKGFGEVDAKNIGVGFRNGATWALEQLDPLCSDGAAMIEKLQAENEDLIAKLELANKHGKTQSEFADTFKDLKIEWENEANKLQAENERLREVLEIARKYAIVEYGESAACRIIASEIQQVFPVELKSELEK